MNDYPHDNSTLSAPSRRSFVGGTTVSAGAAALGLASRSVFGQAPRTRMDIVAFAQDATVVLAEGDHLDRPARHGIAHVSERTGRQREHHGCRLGQGQRDDRRRIRSAYDVARIDQANAHAAVARRDDGGVTKIGLRRFDGAYRSQIEFIQNAAMSKAEREGEMPLRRHKIESQSN